MGRRSNCPRSLCGCPSCPASTTVIVKILSRLLDLPDAGFSQRQACLLLGLHLALISMQVLFQKGRLQWSRLENLIKLAQEGSGGLDLSDTVRDGARVVLMDDELRQQLLLALTDDDRLHVEVCSGVPMHAVPCDMCYSALCCVVC